MGQHIVVFQQLILTLNQLRSLGREMVRFHRVSSTLTLPGERWIFDLNTTFFHPLERLQATFGADQEGYTWLQNQVNYVAKKLSHINTAGFPTGYCHFDFLPKNVHFDGDSVTLFDFMGYGGWSMKLCRFGNIWPWEYTPVG